MTSVTSTQHSNKSRIVFFTVNLILSLVSAGYWLWLIYPGIHTTDSVKTLIESFPGSGIGTWYSVMFTSALQLFNYMFGYSLGYPAIWGFVFWTVGCIAFTQGIFNLTRKWHALVFTLIFFYLPPVSFIFPYMQVRDVNLSAAFLAAYGSLFYSVTSTNRRRWLIVSAILFIPAIGFRHNSFFAFIPAALVYGGFIARSFISRNKMVKGLVMQCFVGAIVATAFVSGKLLFDYSFRDYRSYLVEGSIFYFDLGGLSLRTGEMLIPADRLQPGTTMAVLDEVYEPGGWDPMWGGWYKNRRILANDDQLTDVGEIAGVWFASIRRFPGEYIAHRTEHFNILKHWRNTYINYELPKSGQDIRRGFMLVTPPHLRDGSPLHKFEDDDFELKHYSVLNSFQSVNALLSKKIGRWLYSTSPHFCLKILSGLIIIAALVLCLDWVRKISLSAEQSTLIWSGLMILASGWIYFNAYFLISISSEWRYIHWSHMSMYIGSALLLYACKSPNPRRLRN
jgi:hypothetical protein